MISTENFIPKPETKPETKVQFRTIEMDMLKLIAEDKNGDQIAKVLYKSPRTIENIRNNLKSKLGVQTLAGLVAKAFALGLIEVPKEETQQIAWQLRA